MQLNRSKVSATFQGRPDLHISVSNSATDTLGYKTFCLCSNLRYKEMLALQHQTRLPEPAQLPHY